MNHQHRFSYLFALGVMVGITLTPTHAYAVDQTAELNPPATAQDALLTVKSEVHIVENFVRLKHLVDHPIKNPNDADILICRKPLLHKPLTLSQAYLQNLLKTSGISAETYDRLELPAEVKIIAEKSVWTPTTTTTAQPTTAAKKDLYKKTAVSAEEIDSVQITKLIAEYTENLLQKYEPQVMVQPPTSAPWKVRTPKGYDLKILPGVQIGTNSIAAKIAVYYQNTLIETRSFNFKADIFVKTLVANTQLEKGTIIKPGDFTLRSIPYTANALSAVRNEVEIVGYELQRNIRLGEPIELSNINTPILVNRGASVSVIVKSEGFSIHTTGIAQEAGRLGDQIQVSLKNADSKIRCSVSGENIVDVIQ